MSDLDPATSQAEVGTVSGRPGAWRIMLLLTALAAMVIFAVDLSRGRAGNDRSAAVSTERSTRLITVAVADLPVSDSTRTLALGLPRESASAAIGEPLAIPGGPGSVIALVDGADIVGLAVVDDGDTAEISPESTARALLRLAPGVFGRDTNRSRAQVDAIASDAAFVDLVNAVAVQPLVSDVNEPVEVALAKILERLRLPNPLPDQGCDSILDTQAYAAAGACVQPGDTSTTVKNEQDRWLLAYPAPDGATPCAGIGPEASAVSEVSIAQDACPEAVVLVGPGPATVSIAGDWQTQIEAAAAITTADNWALPFMAAVGASPPEQSSTEALFDSLGDYVNALSNVRSADTGAALTAGERHLGTILSARTMLNSDQIVALTGTDPSVPLLLTALYERAAETMTNAGTASRWSSPGLGLVATEPES